MWDRVSQDRKLIESSLANKEKGDNPLQFNKFILNASRAIAPVLLPMIDVMGELELDDIMVNSELVLEHEA